MTKAELTKDEKIKKEILRLKRVFRDLDKNMMNTVLGLIETAAFLKITIDELQEIINVEGYTEEYQNGANQTGRKQTEHVKTHIAMTRNLTVITKQLSDLTPPVRKKASRLQALRDE